jgi:(p)ppGpp synthase/HD superfamily hydrolase
MKLYNLANPEELEDQVKIHDWACQKHNESGCTYSGYPYKLHLDAVVNVGKQYLYLIPENMQFAVLASCSLHDVMEDCGVSHNKIATLPLLKKYTTFDRCDYIADIVYNVTNELGRNRKERASKSYPKIASCKYSTFVKLCDRIGNLKFSYFCNDEKGMFEMYKKESPEFYKNLHNPEHNFEDMWKEISYLTLI